MKNSQKSKRISKNSKTGEKHENMFGRAEKINTIRTKDTIRKDRSKVTDQRRKTGKIQRHTKQYIPKQRKKILPASRGRIGEDIPTTGCEGDKKCWSKIWERRVNYKKAEWINNMEKELQILEEDHKVDIHLDSLKATV